jgi:hypothetical protein
MQKRKTPSESGRLADPRSPKITGSPRSDKSKQDSPSPLKQGTQQSITDFFKLEHDKPSQRKEEKKAEKTGKIKNSTLIVIDEDSDLSYYRYPSFPFLIEVTWMKILLPQISIKMKQQKKCQT